MAFVSHIGSFVNDEKGETTANALATTNATGADQNVQQSDLSFEEDTQGGLGRHLGLMSTTLLMFVFSIHHFAAFADLG